MILTIKQQAKNVFAIQNTQVVSIGRLTAFYVVFVPMEHIPNKPPYYKKVESFCKYKTKL